jgi:hypothetical protein
MAARIAFTWLSIAALPMMVLAQAPPPEVDQALRARVSEFLQYHVDGNFRKAYDMVAEDTKDNYFSIGKIQLTGFKIDSIVYNDDFTKATVNTTMSKMFNFQGQDFPVTMPSTITWKVENGKWVWYNDVKPTWVTPMGPSVFGQASPNTPKANDSAGPAPKDLDDKAIAAAARSILQQTSVNKKDVMLATDKASEERVIFHNGMPGSVQLELAAPAIPGLTAKLEQTVVRSAGDVAVVFRYEPGAQAAPSDPINVQLLVQPLNQAFVIQVHLVPPGPLAPK